LSQPLGDPSFFLIVAATNTNLLIPINEVNPGGGANQTFRLIVEGFYDTEYSEIPESASPSDGMWRRCCGSAPMEKALQ